MFDQQRIPTIPIFVDSPLAVQITEVFRKHSELYDDEANQFLSRPRRQGYELPQIV